MTLRKLSSTDAFLVTDLADAPSAGIVRSAPKILPGGARDLARSLTYTFATFGIRRSGASAGINAKPDERGDAIRAFVDELGDEVASGSLALDAGKGVADEDLAPLTALDGRNTARDTPVGDDPLRLHLAGIGPAFAANHAIGLEKRTVAIEGFGAHGPALADAVEAHGGRVVAVSTAAGSKTGEDLSAAELRADWSSAGDAMVGDDAQPAWKVFQAEADVLFVGSKMGAVDHTTAEKLQITALVPHQPIPFTARALAVLQRADITVLPDFVVLAAPIFADWPVGGGEPADVIASASAAIAEALDDTGGHQDGAFLGACHRAEAFLRTWQTELPFGRPLAS